MFRFRFFLPVILALGLLVMNPPLASAQKGGGGRGGGTGAHHSGGAAGSHHGGSFNHGHYYPGAFGLYYDPFWYGYGGSRFYDYGYVSPRYYDSYYNGYPSNNYVSPAATVAPAEPLNQTAQIDVRLPRADAKVWVDGNPMSTAGTQRAFYSPTLEPGYNYSYRVTAAWVENGQEVRVERTVPVAPNRRSLVDFTAVNTTPRMPPAKD